MFVCPTWLKFFRTDHCSYSGERVVKLLTVLLSCLKTGAAHSRTHSHMGTYENILVHEHKYFLCIPPKQTLHLVFILLQTHEFALTHLNACTPSNAGTLRSLTDSIFLLLCLLPFSLSLPLLEGHSDRPRHKETTIPADSRGSPSEAALPVASVH